MKLLGLRTAIYKVDDLAKAKEWYAQVLGFAPYFDESFYVGFSVAGFELGLIPDTHSGNKSDSVSTYWGVENIDSSYQRLLELGATTLEAPNEVGGGIWVAMVNDPWDNPFGIIYNPYFGTSAQ
ncbi:MAG: VOC family protein [Cyclobacteriaceae bacterium]|nr:VOC family protein [Cyclobacteriaceae bacterium]